MNQNDPFASVRVQQEELDTIQKPQEKDVFADVRVDASIPKGETFSDLLFSPEETGFEKGLSEVLRAIGRGASKTGQKILQGNITSQQKGSLGALLGSPPSTATEESILSGLQSVTPEESKSPIARTVEQGVEYATDPISLFGGGPIVMGTVGAVEKGLEEAGAPRWLQIAGGLASTFRFGKPGAKSIIQEGSPELKQAQKLMKDRGLTEEEITLATNALKERGGLEKLAMKYKSTSRQIESTKESLDKGVNEIVSEVFPGFEKGIEEVQARASKLFQPVSEQASVLTIKNPDKFVKESSKIISDIERTLANSPDEKAFIDMLKTAQNSALEGKTADNYINFYQTLNRIGKWVDPSKKELYMRGAKDSIKDTFRGNGRFGVKLAEDFEIANRGWMRFNQAEKLNTVLEKSMKDGQIDFQKLSKQLATSKNSNIANQALGEKAANNLKEMAKIGEQVQRFDKSISGGLVKKGIEAGEAFGFVQALMTLDPTIIGSSAFALGSLNASRYLATQLLTNPKYQNLWKKTARAYLNGNEARAIELAKEIEKLAIEEYSEEE